MSSTTDVYPLFEPLQLGPTHLENRLALAPMTRVSAAETGEATEVMAAYYDGFARGGFGLLITEGVYTDTEFSQGYLFQPGLALPEHVPAWQNVVDRVHASGARIFAQLMHAGSQAQGNRFKDSTIGPSAIAPKGEQLAMYRGSGPYYRPAEISREQMEQHRQGIVEAPLRPQEAGFDGIEIHGATGYLIDEFLTAYLNHRTDEYGGPAANRVRFATEICRDIRAAVGAEMTVGIRISQGKVSDNAYRWENGVDDAAAIFKALGETGIDFVHTTEYRAMDPAFEGSEEPLALLAKRYGGVPVIANGNLDDPTDAAEMVRTGTTDIVALGKPALANRDWPRKVLAGEKLIEDLDSTLFGPVANVKEWELTL